MKEKLCTALTVAGSDPSGGAGIQADLKTFSAFGVYGQSVITALTAQNINEVKSIHNLPGKFIGEQFDSLAEDLGFNAVKIGMLSNRGVVETVTGKIIEYKLKKIVLDPVITSSTGARLLGRGAIKLFKEELVPLSLILTPNIPEAEELSGIRIDDIKSLKKAAEELKKLGCTYVLIKGGHRRDVDSSDDVLFDGKSFTHFRAKRVKSTTLHGTGCTFSAAICANLAAGEKIHDAVRIAKKYMSRGIRESLKLRKKDRRFVHHR